MLGGILLLFVRPDTINDFVHWLTQHELAEDRHDFIAQHLLHSASHLTHGTTLFAAFYLLSHGLTKVVLVVAVLKRRLWAYPAIIVVLLAFIVYQLYRLSYRFTIGLALLTIFDAFVAWLTWREYQGIHAHEHDPRHS